ncbi:hypothetical protein N7510_004464 [Penicillium lagena]|uniref:uncharacterized protein n=1 Tax=Penicillium lagena TaxID=94218 RepID=UPI0025418D56|nr:uncharacterized protein N7510_004464 [Penicillium lagena]KAJ5620480.1 hypothetical protein N7510_004464 [Penicillium lagena]
MSDTTLDVSPPGPWDAFTITDGRIVTGANPARFSLCLVCLYKDYKGRSQNQISVPLDRVWELSRKSVELKVILNMTVSNVPYMQSLVLGSGGFAFKIYARKAILSGINPHNPKQKWVYYTEAAKVTDSSLITDDKVATKAPSSETGQETVRFCEVDNNQRRDYLIQLLTEIHNGATKNLYSANLLLSVTQFNVVRAMYSNATSLGLTADLLGEDIASQFNIVGPLALPLPPSLQPTSHQKKIIHHPWIDLIPMVSLRDVLLGSMYRYDEDELCGDLFGLCGTSREVGLFIWGEAWDPSAYEASEKFVQKWSWIFKDCPDILESTNYWRRKRGERPLRLDFSGAKVSKFGEDSCT